MPRRLLICLLTTFFLAFSNPMFAEKVFPQIALGGGYEVILIISNKSAELDWEADIQLLQGSGQSWQGTWLVNGQDQTGTEDFEISIPALGTSRVEITGDDQLRIGYLTILKKSSFEGDVTVALFYNFRQGGQLVDCTATAPSLPDYRFLIPVEKRNGISTGFAWAPYDYLEPFSVDISLVDSEGIQISQASYPFEGHWARFFDEIFTGVPNNFVGSLRFNAEKHFYLTALRMDSTGSTPQLTSTPPGRLSVESGLNLEVIRDSMKFTDSYGMWEVTGKVVSHLKTDAYFVSVLIRAYDSKGRLLDSNMVGFVEGTVRKLIVSDIVTNTCLLEGETGYFETPLFNIDGEPEMFEVIAYAQVSETLPSLGSLTVTEYTLSGGSGRASIDMNLLNEGTVGVIPGFVHVALIDNKGKVLELALDRMPEEEIEPGENLSLTVTARSNFSDVDQVVILPDWDEVETSTTSLSELEILHAEFPVGIDGSELSSLLLKTNPNPQVKSQPVRIRLP